ncbi:MAG: GNAT family N-acetyltransferase [Cytophagales bacterium]|nr:MAG: GNAT family N-acetyltransferase [Cytophagales bacterium]TAF62297.1 MAG: GNAT family N-acetyltransferase [Cytophagales bacterium]
MEIKKLLQHEIEAFKTLITIFNEVFENEAEIPAARHLEKLLSNPDFMVFVVQVNGQVVGGLTIYVLHRYYDTKPIAYIYDVGITPNFQGKGLGKALIAEVCRFCRESGFEDAYVEAESEDKDAVEFYRKTNFTYEMAATHFTYSFD